MKKNKLNIVFSWILLVCFTAGQYMVSQHQHKLLKQANSSFSNKKNGQKPVTTVQEKCYVCDAMHHTAAILNSPAYCLVASVLPHIYKTGDHAFISISLVLASGRAPPVSSLYC